MLVLTQDADAEHEFKKISYDKTNIKMKLTNFEKFQEGKKEDKFDFVVVWAGSMTTDDFEM